MSIEHTTPIHKQIHETLRREIKTGLYKPGDRLPLEAELAKRFSVTRATVVLAMQGLLFEGIIERIRGRGTFVAKPAIVTTVNTGVLSFFEQDMISSGKKVSYRVLNFTKTLPKKQIQDKLGISANENVHHLLRQRIVDNQPVAIEIRYLPSLLALKISLKQLEMLPLQTIFQNVLKLNIATINNQVRVALASKGISEWLEIKRNRPVMIRCHRYLDEHNTPILWGETVYREEFEIHYTSQENHLMPKAD